MARLREAMRNVMLLTGIITGLNKIEACRMLSFLRRFCTSAAVSQRCERRTSIRQHRVDPVWHRRDEGAQAVGGNPTCGLLMPLGNGNLAGTVNGREELQAACNRSGG
jgi:hypothetical protein